MSDDDSWLWMSEQWWVPWVMVVAALTVGLWMIRSLTLHRGRDRAVRRAAAAAGMRFQEQDGPGLSRIRFRHFLSGEAQGWTATNVVTASSSDGDVHAFDARSWIERETFDNADLHRRGRRRPGRSTPTATRVRHHTGRTVSAAVAKLPINAPLTIIARENVATKLFGAVTRLDIDVESESFNRSYCVVSDDRHFARALLDARVVDLMVRGEGKIAFEFFGRYLLVHTVQIEPELLPGLARLAGELRRVIPQLVVDGWPSGDQAAFKPMSR